ncbi:portal protein [Mailhella sp.]
MRNELRAHIVSALQDCMGAEGTPLSQARAALKRRYLGHGYEADAERRERGLSTYVDRTVMETIEWAKPCLMRIFSNTELLRFEPRSPGQEQAAEDASAYINHLIFNKNIFRLVHDVLTDGLYQRLGWCLVHAPLVRSRRMRRLSGLSREEVLALLCDPKLAPDAPGAPEVRVTRRERDDSISSGNTSASPVYDVLIRRSVESREIRLDPVPSEQVLISGDAQDVEHARFIAFWQIRTASDLRKDGWPETLIASLPPFESGRVMPETEAGRAVNHTAGGSALREGRAPQFGAVPPGREFKIFEAWFDFDIDGDGVAEKVKAVFAGEGQNLAVMGWEEWPMYRPPLFSACSVPLPHQVGGLCVADLVSDVQDLRTEVTRQYLDNLALANQGELVVNEGRLDGSVEFDSLLARGVGAVHRIKGDASITPLPVSTSSADALSGLQMCEGLAERRTGISSRTQSLGEAALPHTATGASIIEEAVNQRMELVARVYAETFFKPLGRYLLHLLYACRDKGLELRLFGRPMAFDLHSWDPDMDIACCAAMSGASRQKQVATYSKILELQYKMLKELGEASPVSLAHVVHTCHKLAEASGLEAPERFFGTREDARFAASRFAEARRREAEARAAQSRRAEQAGQAQLQALAQARREQNLLENRKLALKVSEARNKLALDARKLALEERKAG